MDITPINVMQTLASRTGFFAACEKGDDHDDHNLHLRHHLLSLHHCRHVPLLLRAAAINFWEEGSPPLVQWHIC